MKNKPWYYVRFETLKSGMGKDYNNLENSNQILFTQLKRSKH